MVNVSTQDLMDVLFISRKVFEYRKVDELRRAVLRLLERILEADSSTFFLISEPEKRLKLFRCVARGIDDKFLGLFHRYYHGLDPFPKKLFSAYTDVLITDEVIPYRSLMRTEYYHDFLKPQCIHHQMSINLKSGNQLLGVVSLFRPRNVKAFSSKHKAKAKMMAPFLAGALEKTLAFDKIFKIEAIIKSIVSELPYKGIVVLDGSLEPVYYNENAVSIFSNLNQTKKHLKTPLGPLPKEVYLQCKDLLNPAGLRVTAKPHQHQFTILSPCNRQKISVHLRLIALWENPLLLVCLEPEEHILCLSNQLKDRGLTRRELDVVYQLSVGLKNTEIGERLFISPYTVDNHLKSIYRKMNVKNRTSLVHRLNQLTPTYNLSVN